MHAIKKKPFPSRAIWTVNMETQKMSHNNMTWRKNKEKEMKYDIE